MGLRYSAKPTGQVADSADVCDYDELEPVAKRRFLDLVDAENPVCVSPKVADTFATHDVVRFTHYFNVQQVH
jgi:hypothetical protein